MTVKRWWLDGRAPWGRGLGRKGKLDHGLHWTQRARTHACNPYPSAPWSPWCNTLGVRIADERGIALIGVVVLSALLLTLAVALALNVTSDTQLRGALGSGVTGFYAAESGLNLGLEEYRIMLLADRPPGEADFAERSFTLGDRQVAYKLTPQGGEPRSIAVPAGELFAGVNALESRYTVRSKATNDASASEAAVGAELLVDQIPVFQFIAFYANDLEISPGPPMRLQGRVHTNGDLYLNSAAGPLDIEDNPAVGVRAVQVSAGKGIHRGRKSEDKCEGAVHVDMLADADPANGDLDARNLPCHSAVSAAVPTDELSQWKGSAIAGLDSIAAPKPDIIKPPANVSAGGSVDSGIYWNNADLRIVMRVNQNGQLPGGPVLPYRIEVVDAAGHQDLVRTAQLYAFMGDGGWNAGAAAGRGPSSFPGTMPIFVTDVPFAAGSTCTNTTPLCDNASSASYAPALPSNPPPPLAPRALAPGVGVYTEQMGTGDPIGGPFSFDLDYRRGGFYNWRERKWMLLLNLNLRDLLVWNQQNGEPFFSTTDRTDDGLVIFATIDGPTSSGVNNYGIRIFGSADLPLPGGIGASPDPTGLTMVSDQAVYVLGDFNRGVAAGGLPRQPAAIVGDSVNLLSQAYWRSANPALCGASCCTTQLCRDGQSAQALADASRNASSTSINAAFLGGVDDTPAGYQGRSSYNGGLENYPRMHENWSGQRLSYQGSFVSLGKPAHVDGRWCGAGGPPCDIYNPPDRNWNFDAAFNNVANLPPLTPRFIHLQQVLFAEDFH